MARWPLWRLLIATEAWLLAVAAYHRWRPIHDDFIVPLMIAVVPGLVLVAMWALAKAATEQSASGEEQATIIELLVASISVVASASWTVQWAMEAYADLRRINEMLGAATIIIDISLTGLSAAACFAALALDWLLATAHEQLRATMTWLRRTHLVATLVLIAALFGSAWLFMQLPDTATPDATTFERARLALHVYEYAKATVFPLQAFFAAMAVAVVAADSRTS